MQAVLMKCIQKFGAAAGIVYARGDPNQMFQGHSALCAPHQGRIALISSSPGRFFKDFPAQNTYKMISAHAKSGNVVKALQLLQEIPASGRSIFISNLVLKKCVLAEMWDSAEEVFRNINHPNNSTYATMVQLLASTGRVMEAKEMLKNITDGPEANFAKHLVMNALGRQGQQQDVRQVFDSVDAKDVVSWTSLIQGYAQNCMWEQAVQTFQGMLLEGLKPNSVTFLSLLGACARGADSETTGLLFRSMLEDHDSQPEIKHYTKVIHALALGGKFRKAHSLLLHMPYKADAAAWMALLTASRLRNNPTYGEKAAAALFKIDEGNGAPYVMLAAIYYNVGREEEAKALEATMRAKGIVRVPGMATIVVNGMPRSFMVGSRSLEPEISEELDKLHMEMAAHGFTPNYQDSFGDESHDLCSHSEKLALAYGLLKMKSCGQIHIKKSLRMCRNCHSSTALVSKIRTRVISVEDAAVTHVFVAGSCITCKNFW